MICPFVTLAVTTGVDDPDFLPDAIGWEGINPRKGTKEMKPKEIDLQSMNPARWFYCIFCLRVSI